MNIIRINNVVHAIGDVQSFPMHPVVAIRYSNKQMVAHEGSMPFVVSG